MRKCRWPRQLFVSNPLNKLNSCKSTSEACWQFWRSQDVVTARISLPTCYYKQNKCMWRILIFKFWKSSHPRICYIYYLTAFLRGFTDLLGSCHECRPLPYSSFLTEIWQKRWIKPLFLTFDIVLQRIKLKQARKKEQLSKDLFFNNCFIHWQINVFCNVDILWTIPEEWIFEQNI